MRREFLMLAQVYDPSKHRIAGWYVSQKCDGQRCFWDGGVSRGILKSEIPWANTIKDERYVEPPVATGLWSRYGNVIHAPDWWLDHLPKDVCLDGELYMDRGMFQETRKIISTLVPDERWHAIRYMIFDAPSPILVFQTGRIKNPNFNKEIVDVDCLRFFNSHGRPKQFQSVDLAMWSDVTAPLEQRRLSDSERQATETLFQMLETETSVGGEGLMLRDPLSYWFPKRVPQLLKVKKLDDSEGTVVGYTWGVGKLEGLMGAAVIEWRGKKFNLSGFTDDERVMVEDINPRFPIGSLVTFRYYGLTNDGIPRSARYWRQA